MKNYCTLILFFFLQISIAQTPCTGGFASGYPCSNIDLQAFMSKTNVGGTGNVNDVWGWTDPLTGKEYALLGLTNGTSFIDVSDPVNPIYLGILPTQTFNSSWRDVKVIENYAYVVSEASGHGIQSFDLTTLRGLSGPPVTFTPYSTLLGIAAGNAHNVVSFEEIEYIVIVGVAGAGNCSGGLIFIDVSDPSNMRQDGCFSADGYTHDAVCFIYRGPDTEHFGKQICVASNEDSQTIVDITDKQNPVQLSRLTYPGSNYTHQSWYTDDQKYMLFDDELDEFSFGHLTRTYVMDMSDLDLPVFIDYYQATTQAIDHNQYIRGQYVYQSNYRAGLRILETRGIATADLTEVAYFDTYPAAENNDNRSTSSAWSVYPYFESGNVLISDIQQGMFIVKPNNPHFVMSAEKIPPVLSKGEDVVFNIDLKSYSGYSDMVKLSLDASIAGATLTFGSTSISASGSTTLTISGTENLEGAYHLVIQGRGPSDNVIHDLAIAFKIIPRYYVDQTMTSSGDGGSWATAYKTVNEAITALPSIGGQIWIAAGTYLPTTGSDRNISFNVSEDISIYGGFSGVEVNVAERDINANQTILSGNIGDPGLTSDNSYHVVQTSGSTSNCILDGLFIKGGNANSAGDTSGGGLLSDNHSTELRNCSFSENMASTGSAIYNTGNKLILQNCEIIGLDAEMIVSEPSKVVIQNNVTLKSN